MDTAFRFFMWNTIINSGIIILWLAIFLPFSDGIFELHHQIFSISREDFNLNIYTFLGVYKILLVVFNAIPLISLAIIRKQVNQRPQR